MKKQKYDPSERTPASMRCGIGLCPAIYFSDSPARESCFGGLGCPTIKDNGRGSYLIIGRQLKPVEVEETGLARQIGEGEVLIEVPRKLIDEMQKG